MFQASEKLLSSFSSLINIVRRKCSTTKNVCSNQVGGCFLVYSSLISIARLMLYNKNCVIKASGNLLFSLLSYFSNTKNVCSKQAGGCFLLYLLLFSIILLECFYYKFYKDFREGCSLNCCYLVYLGIYIKASADGCFLVYVLLIIT